MSSIYYITSSEGEIFELDATLSVNINLPAQLTDYTIEDGSSGSDHYILRNQMVTVNGRISDVKSSKADLNVSKTTDEFITGIQDIRNSKKAFTFTWRDDRIGGGATYQLNGCMFENISITQNKESGYAFGHHSYNISLNIKQKRSSERARIVVEKDDLIVDMTATKKAGMGGTKSFDDEETDIDGKPNSLGLFGTLLGAGR